MGVLHNAWFIVENSTKMDDLVGVPLFQETTIWDSIVHYTGTTVPSCTQSIPIIHCASRNLTEYLFIYQTGTWSDIEF